MSGEQTGLLPSLFDGTEAGTFIAPKGKRLPSRKHWIAFTLRTKGRLTLDDGAVDALVQRGKSLLPSGIADVSGDFSPGDAVACLDREGKEIAKGLVNFSSEMLKQIRGLKTADIQKTIGAQEYQEAIHRDNLVIL